ncbi:DUF6233 domain-containing protein [Streptomyces sp. NPDC002692]
MSELSNVERLAKLRTLEAWLGWQLRDTQRKIEGLAQQVRAVEGYVTEQERRAGKAVGATLHAADCAKILQPVTTLDATKAQYALMKDPGTVHACEHCRPDRALGVPEK